MALRVGFGSMNRIILALRFQDASSSSVESKPFALRFFGRNGGGALGKEMRWRLFAIFPRRGSGSKQRGGAVASCGRKPWVSVHALKEGQRRAFKNATHKYLGLYFECLFVRPFVARLLVEEAEICEEGFGIGTEENARGRFFQRFGLFRVVL